MDGCDEVDEWDEEREASVRGGGRLDSASVSFGSGEEWMVEVVVVVIVVVSLTSEGAGLRSGEEDGDGGVVDVSSYLRLIGRTPFDTVVRVGVCPCPCPSASSSLQSQAALSLRLIRSPPS